MEASTLHVTIWPPTAHALVSGDLALNFRLGKNIGEHSQLEGWG